MDNTLSQAITAVETSATNLGTADSAQQAAQAKFDEAQASKQGADSADADAVSAFNASLDALVAAATAAKVSRS